MARDLISLIFRVKIKVYCNVLYSTLFSTFRFRSLSFTLPVMSIMFTPDSYPFVVLLRKQTYRKATAMFQHVLFFRILQ